MKQTSNSILLWIGRLHAVPKLFISLFIAVIVYMIIPNDPTFHTNFMISWDIFSFMMVLISWITFFTVKYQGIRDQSQKQDISKIIIYVLIIISALASLAEVLFLLSGETNTRLLIIVITGMLLSWVLIHTIFAFHYAHLYYRNDENDAADHIGGLNFPGDKKPDYRDFAYFSFVLGMTFQVSDVTITSKKFRRLALLHGLISFIFNTFFVALTINLISGLKGMISLRNG